MTVFLGFAALEIYSAHELDTSVKYSRAIYDGILSDRDNVLKVKPHFRGEWKGEDFSVLLRTNSRGYREDFEFDDKDVDIAFMGDSFAFGHGVDVKDRYTNVAARLCPGRKVVSLSYNNGFQPEHYEYFLERHPELKPKFLFVGLYLGNDLDSDLAETVTERDAAGKITKLSLPYREIYRGVLINAVTYRYPWWGYFVRATDIGKIIMKRLNGSPEWRQKLIKKNAVIPNTPNRLTTELGELDSLNERALIALKKIDELVKGRRGQMHVLLIPQNFLVGDAKYPHIASGNKNSIDKIRAKNGLANAVLDFCKCEGIPCHDLSKILTPEDYMPKDAHWNERGNEKVGRYVGRVIAGGV